MGATANGGMLTNLSSKQKGRITNKFKPPLKKDTPDAAKAKESLSIDLNDARLKNIEPRMIETIKNEVCWLLALTIPLKEADLTNTMLRSMFF